MKNGFLWIYERCYVLYLTDPIKYLKKAISNKLAMTDRPPIVLPGDDHNQIEILLGTMGLSRYFPKYTLNEKELITFRLSSSPSSSVFIRQTDGMS